MRERKLANRGGGWAHRPRAEKKIKQLTSEQASYIWEFIRKDKMKREEAISILNHVIEYYAMNYDTGEEENTKKEIKKAWDALEVLINENKRSR